MNETIEDGKGKIICLTFKKNTKLIRLLIWKWMKAISHYIRYFGKAILKKNAPGNHLNTLIALLFKKFLNFSKAKKKKLVNNNLIIIL